MLLIIASPWWWWFWSFSFLRQRCCAFATNRLACWYGIAFFWGHVVICVASLSVLLRNCCCSLFYYVVLMFRSRCLPYFWDLMKVYCIEPFYSIVCVWGFQSLSLAFLPFLPFDLRCFPQTLTYSCCILSKFSVKHQKRPPLTFSPSPSPYLSLWVSLSSTLDQFQQLHCICANIT